MRKFNILGAITALSLSATTALAADWTLNGEMSNVAFGSIKNDYVGESHRFKQMSGSVGSDGAVTIELALGSVETLIDIRNERMAEHVFKNAPSATINASIDMASMEALAVGGATTIETTGTLNLLGEKLDLDATLFVMRLADDSVMAVTDSIIMLSTEDAGIDDSISKLQELAELDSITRVSPVTMRLMFSKGQ